MTKQQCFSHCTATLTHDTKSLHHILTCLKIRVFICILPTSGSPRHEQQEDHEATCVRCRQKFFSSSTDMADHTVPPRDTAQNTSLSRIRHSTAVSTGLPKMAALILESAGNPLSLHQKAEKGPGDSHVMWTCRKLKKWTIKGSPF